MRTKGLGSKIVASLQSPVGGEVASFTREIGKAREEAIERLKAKAKEMGANAPVTETARSRSAFSPSRHLDAFASKRSL